jgi:hypothetical protein
MSHQHNVKPRKSVDWKQPVDYPTMTAEARRKLIGHAKTCMCEFCVFGWTYQHKCSCAEQEEYFGSYYCRTPIECKRKGLRPGLLSVAKQIFP